MSPLYMHPAHMRKPVWKRVWLRLCRYIVDGAAIGARGFLTRSRAIDYFYHASNNNETHAPIDIYRKAIGAKLRE